MASLTDCLVECKRMVQRLPEAPLEYHSMFVMADELSAFMDEYKVEMIGGLTTFYDVETLPYGQHRRSKDIRIKIKRPQLNMLVGSTPSNLIKFIPEIAWDQGFTSRVILVFSDERPIGDIFDNPSRELPGDMLHDIKSINTLVGEFRAEVDYKREVNAWRKAGLPFVLNHPKLVHYNTRRLAHLLKLSMVASVNRGDSLVLTLADFETAKQWLVEVEGYMPEIFRAGALGADSRAMDEILHYVKATDVNGKGITETKLVRFTSERIPAHSVMRVIGIMVNSGMIRISSLNEKTGARSYSAVWPGEIKD